MSFTYPYPRPAVTVDSVVFGLSPDELSVLLIERNHPPCEGRWAFPGGFVDENEPLAAAVQRELFEETGLAGVELEQIGAYGDPGRDPRAHTVSVVFGALVAREGCRLRAASDARRVEWFPLDAVPSLAFDHRLILNDAQRWLRRRARHEPIGMGLLPKQFRWRDLQKIYEIVLRQAVDGASLRDALMSSSILREIGGSQAPRPIEDERWYAFDDQRYKGMRGCGFTPSFIIEA
jgi:8-oxo-dGTP diphosphatase